ncbi:uncharacterized protein [Aristolochia californica]|uniref:uncharacterized protein n=1 Tax=Aristolochia californica TaxID=171875 RepID=UPI0035DC1339
MSTIFVALQCCQCATMQVKQQKKSSNKWTCVICNQKQSVCKVFARGFLAKDIRKFVQDFNMSRQIADTQLSGSPDCEETMPKGRESVEYQEKRTDWKEYLDGPDKENEDPSSDGEIQIVTEPPREMLRKARVRAKYSPDCCDTKRTAGGSEILQPNFMKRKGNKKFIQLKDSADSKKCRRVTTQVNASKWCDYLNEEEMDMLSKDEDFPNDYIPSNGFRDERVEEDVHPDFL